MCSKLQHNGQNDNKRQKTRMKTKDGNNNERQPSFSVFRCLFPSFAVFLSVLPSSDLFVFSRSCRFCRLSWFFVVFRILSLFAAFWAFSLSFVVFCYFYRLLTFSLFSVLVVFAVFRHHCCFLPSFVPICCIFCHLIFFVFHCLLSLLLFCSSLAVCHGNWTESRWPNLIWPTGRVSVG